MSNFKKCSKCEALDDLITVDDAGIDYWIEHLNFLHLIFLRDDAADCKTTRLQVLAAHEELQNFFKQLRD